MQTKKGNQTLHIRIMPPDQSGESLSQAEVKARLTSFFALLLEMEIDQQNNVAKEYSDAEQTD